MSTQFGGDASDDAVNRETNGREADTGCQAEHLHDLIERIAQQLNDADQRHSATLEQMLARVEALGAEARSYRTKVPSEFLPAFERIEDGVLQLADRIASTHSPRAEHWNDPTTTDVQSQPAPIASHTELDVQAETHSEAAPEAYSDHAAASEAMYVAPFQADEAAHAIDPVMANDSSAWDQQAADALRAHYENELGADVGYNDENYDEAPPYSDMSMLATTGMPQPQVASTAVHDVRAALLDSERDWLEERFVDIARKVEDSLLQSSHEPALAILDARFEQLEQRFGSAMNDIATRSDIEALHILEAHISDLTQQFEDTRGQLNRLDSIEHSLAAVIDRLTDPRFDDAHERAAPAEADLEPLISTAVDQIAKRLNGAQATMPDLQGIAENIADAAAERVALRFADMAPVRNEGSSVDVGAIRELLDQFVNERREGEEQTAAMIDTMQRALIRVLDRVDALETSNAKPAAADYGRYAPEPAASRPVDNGAMAQAVAYGTPEQEAFARPFAEPAPPTAANPQPLRQQSSPASIERLRQDFIADARRAKEKAANAANATEATSVRAPVEPAPMSEPATNGAKPGKQPSKTGADTTEARASAVSRLRSPSRKLLVGAIVLMIAIPGVLMLLKKNRAAEQTPTAIEHTEAPSDRAIVPVSPVKQTEDGATGQPAQSQQAPMPAMPSSENTERGAQMDQSAPVKALPETTTVPKAEGVQPASKDHLFRSRPKTQTRGLNPDMEVPAGIEERRDSRLPSDALANDAPPAGITVATPRNNPSLTQLERLSERQTLAQLSSQLGEAQVNAVPATLIPEFMHGESTSEAAPSAPRIQASISDSRRQPLDLPPAQVGPMSLRMAAANGDPSAEFAVAIRLADGTGVKQDLSEALRWYQRSAARGFAQSQYRVATFYERGLGVKQDNARAKIWYQRAAENGNVKAMHNLAVLSAGRSAKVPDYTAAAKWFKAAADYGLADSQFNLAVLYEGGLGVSQDTKAAYQWFALAARNGDAEAQRRQGELEQSMKPEELAEARATLDNWRAKQADRIANDPLTASEAWKAQAAAQGAI